MTTSSLLDETSDTGKNIKNLIKNHVVQRFNPNELGYFNLDEGSTEVTEHLAWYSLNAGVCFYDIVSTSADEPSVGDDEADANKGLLFAHSESQTDRVRIYKNLFSSAEENERREIYSTFHWLTRQLPTGRGEIRRHKQRTERWDAFVSKAKGSLYRPELAIHEIRNRLNDAPDCDVVVSNAEMLAFHAAAELGDVEFVKMLLAFDSSLLDDKGYHENTALHFAAMAGQTDVMKLLIEHFQQDVDSIGFNERTPLIWAARNGETQAVEYALERGAKLWKSSGDADHNFLAIHAAAKYGHLETVKVLLSKDDSLKDATDEDGFSALHYASAAGHFQLVETLVEKFHVDINKAGHLDRSPVFVAAMTGCHEIVSYLLSKGAKITMDPPNHPAPIHASSIFGHLKVVEILLSAISQKNSGTLLDDTIELAFHFGHFPLWVVLKTKYRGEKLKAVDVHNILCPSIYRRSQNANSTSVGMLAFNEAAHSNDFEAMGLLISLSDSLLPGEIDYVKALRVSAEKGQLEIVRRLIEEHGMNPDERRGDEGTRTPLTTAASKGHAHVVEYLMTKGADIRARSWNYQLERCERTAIHIAADRGHVCVIEALLSRDDQLINARDGADDVALRYAARSGNRNVLELLISKYGQNVDTPGCADTTPLMYAAGAGQRETVVYLLEKGANPFARTNECYHEGGGGFTAVHFACRAGNVDIIEMLIKRSAKLVNVTTEDGRSLLHWAARCNLLPFVKHLIEAEKMDVNSRGFNGRTPLMEAASAGADRVVSYLLDSGADITARSWDDYAQMTALCFCFQDRDHLATAELLLSRGATLPIELYNYLILLSPSGNQQGDLMAANQGDHDFPEFERLPGAGPQLLSIDS